MSADSIRVFGDTLVTEKQFSQQVVGIAHLLGWTVFRTWSSRHSPAGEPDLRLIRPPRVIFAELKREKGKATALQEEALDLLRQCPGVEVALWRPSDWDNIVEVLT
jgi:hypothetical protein